MNELDQLRIATEQMPVPQELGARLEKAVGEKGGAWRWYGLLQHSTRRALQWGALLVGILLVALIAAELRLREERARSAWDPVPAGRVQP
jgi:hypothetical protein